MKIRKGFVSNSSSSSFIIQPEQLDEATKEHGLTCYKAKEILALLEKTFDEIPDFITNNYYWKEMDEIQALKELIKKSPEAYITDVKDRDDASHQGIEYPEFKGDL